MTAKRFIEFATQNTDNGEINNGFHDIKTGEWYYTKDSENAGKICRLLNELNEEKEMWKRECKRLKGLYYLENEKVELEDIIGLVKTDEPTNSVELKKELYK